ncbi:MAG: SIS domain-containing protein [Pseudomonadota bacterium]
MSDSLKFPQVKYEAISDYARDYFTEHQRCWQEIDMEALSRAAEVLTTCYNEKHWVYVCGNGGSAAIANHYLCDHGKLIGTGTSIKPKVYSLSNSNEMITALGNDIDYSSSFEHPVTNLGEAGDVLVTISASGDSENVVKAIRAARENGMQSISFTAFDGGRSATEADVNLHVPAYNYGVAEDLHQGIMQLLAQYIRQTQMSGQDILEAKF